MKMKNWMKIAAVWTMVLVMVLSCLPAASLRAADIEVPEIPIEPAEDIEVPEIPIEPTEPDILYSAYVQDQGWLQDASSGQVAGTSGLGLRMEAFRIHFPEGSLYEGSGIEYRTHIQKTGWESEWSRDGGISGEEGSGLRIEALQIRLTGALSESYDIYYCVHVQKLGWLSWAKNGEAAGTAGAALRIEALCICLVAKDGAAPAAMGKRSVAYYPRAAVKYAAHVQKIGWQDYVDMGAMAGTSGKRLRVEAVKMFLTGTGRYPDSGIEYRTHVQKLGWESEWKSAEEIAGTTGRGLQVEALQIRLTGSAAEDYDIYYRTHVKNFGWGGWAKNGESSGSTGCGYPVEAFQVKIVIKGMPAPGSTANACRKNVYSSNHLEDGSGCKMYIDRAGFLLKDFTGPVVDSGTTWYVKKGYVRYDINIIYEDANGRKSYFLKNKKTDRMTYFRGFFDEAVFTGSSVVLGLEYYFEDGMCDYVNNYRVLCRGSYSFVADMYQMSGFMLQVNGVEYPARTALRLVGRPYAFINMGTNDLGVTTIDEACSRYVNYLAGIREENPDLIIFIEATTPKYNTTKNSSLSNYKINQFNAFMADYCATQENMYFIDINTPLKDANGCLADGYCSDGYVHITYAGYGVWMDTIVNTLEDRLVNIEF